MASFFDGLFRGRSSANNVSAPAPENVTLAFSGGNEISVQNTEATGMTVRDLFVKNAETLSLDIERVSSFREKLPNSDIRNTVPGDHQVVPGAKYTAYVRDDGKGGVVA